jgi:hypothetical protein
MEPIVFWVMVAWSVANAALWCHAMWLYRRARRYCRRALDLQAHNGRGAAGE